MNSRSCGFAQQTRNHFRSNGLILEKLKWNIHPSSRVSRENTTEDSSKNHKFNLAGHSKLKSTVADYSLGDESVTVTDFSAKRSRIAFTVSEIEFVVETLIKSGASSDGAS